MRVQKESRATWVIAVLSMAVVFSLICFSDDLAQVGDSIFLYNRCYQIRDCLMHGQWPFLYYEDLGGIGYGSPIFYGQLTLFPFMLFLDDIAVFMKMYLLSCILLNFFGFRFFLKRVSSYATLTACFYIASMPFCGLLGANIPACAMAVGFSWFFFGFCIDFFRDSRNLILLILSYFMIWQSNFNSTVLATLVCFGIFLVYFNRSRWKDYLRLFCCTLLVVSYNLVNMFVHRDAIALSDPSAVLSVLNMAGDARVTSIHPLGGYLMRSNIEWMDCCCGFMTILVWVVFLYFVIKYVFYESFRFRVCSSVIGVVTFVGYLIGTCTFWPLVYKATNLFFQFPIRYYILLFGFVLAVLSRVIRPKWFVYLALVLCIVDIFAINPFSYAPTSHIEYVGLQLGNGEYASDSFVKDYGVYKGYSSSVHSESGAVYEFEHNFNEIVVDCSSNPGDDVLTLPKLYYLGYCAIGEDSEKFEVESGYSNYCQVAIGDYKGVLTLSYDNPLIVDYFSGVQIGAVVSLCVVFVWSRCKRWR